jgi:hypothetical protein
MTYDVTLYPLVRVKLAKVEAPDPAAATVAARRLVDLHRLLYRDGPLMPGAGVLGLPGPQHASMVWLDAGQPVVEEIAYAEEVACFLVDGGNVGEDGAAFDMMSRPLAKNACVRCGQPQP